MILSLQRYAKYTVLILIAGVITVLGLAFRDVLASTNDGQGTTVMLVVPKQASVGEPIIVQLVAADVRNLAGFQAKVRFDPTQLRAVSATVNDGLKATGRDLLPLGPVMTVNSVALGAATCPTKDCTSPQYKKAPRVLQGVQGRVELGEVEFSASAPGTYNLSLDNVQLVDPQGTLLGTATANAVISVSSK